MKIYKQRHNLSQNFDVFFFLPFLRPMANKDIVNNNPDCSYNKGNHSMNKGTGIGKGCCSRDKEVVQEELNMKISIFCTFQITLVWPQMNPIFYPT